MSDVSFPADRGMTTRDGEKIQLGTVWRRSFRTFGRAPVTFIAVMLLPLIVSVIQVVSRYSLALSSRGLDAPDPIRNGLVLLFVLTILQYVIQLVSQVASIHIAARLLAGEGFTWGKAIGVGFRRLLPLIGVAILVGLSIVVGFFLLIIPGIILALALALAVPACVVERLGPINSMKRSVFLTRSNRWLILASFLLLILLPILVGGALAFVAGKVLGTIALGIVAVILVLLVLPFLGGISLIMLTVMFVELRALKEGGAATSVSQVFE